MENINQTEKNNFLYQKVRLIRKFSNSELKLYILFYELTHIHPTNVICINQGNNSIIFFFVSSPNYFEARDFLDKLRRILNKKVIIIRAENNLASILYSFFPDLFIYDIIQGDNVKEIVICLLSFKERGIAVGKNGNYIRAVNKIFENYIKLEKLKSNVIIKCVQIDLRRYLPGNLLQSG